MNNNLRVISGTRSDGINPYAGFLRALRPIQRSPESRARTWFACKAAREVAGIVLDHYSRRVGVSVTLVGSVLKGYASDLSDIDLCILVFDKDQVMPREKYYYGYGERKWPDILNRNLREYHKLFKKRYGIKIDLTKYAFNKVLLEDCAGTYPDRNQSEFLYEPLSPLFFPVFYGSIQEIDYWRTEVIKNIASEELWNNIKEHVKEYSQPKEGSRVCFDACLVPFPSVSLLRGKQN